MSLRTRRARGRRVIESLLALTSAGILASGCASLDPTEQSFAITFLNDTPNAIILKLCSDANCRHFDYSKELQPAESVRENVSDSDVLTRWLVQDRPTSKVLGCLPLKFDRKQEDVVVRATEVVRCPGTHPLSVSQGMNNG
jgi:hypothetical protein